MRTATLAFVLLVGGCRTDHSEEQARADAPPPALPAPLDHLPEGKLAAGKEKAFALPLPHAMKVVRRFETSVIAAGEASPESIADFVRLQVKDGQAVVSPSGTRFERVRVPSEPDRLLSIAIESDPEGATKITINDVTPIKEERLAPTPQERMKAAGLTPDGRILDPKHFE